jgi:hypothetical protein
MRLAAGFLFIANITLSRRQTAQLSMATTSIEMQFTLCAASKLFGLFATRISLELRSSST